MTEAQPTNTAADMALELSKAAAYKILLPFLIKKAITKAPFLAMPVINPLFGWAFGWAFNIFYEEESLNLYFQITNAKAAAQGAEAKKAIEALATALQQPITEGNQDEIKRLSEEFDKRMAAAIHTSI